jgi:hypothetical protein
MKRIWDNCKKQIIVSLIVAVILAVGGFGATYLVNGVVAGNQSTEKITSVDKKVDDHITCDKAFQLGVELRLEKKANKEDAERLDNKLNMILDALLNNSKMIKDISPGIDNRSYKIKNSPNYGLHLDTLKPN